MYTTYNIIIANDTDQYIFTYQIEQHRPAQEWANIMSKLSVDCLRPGFNNWVGIKKDPQPLINELLLLVQELNKWLPNKINKVWDNSNIQESVNQFHTHFPEQENERDPNKRKQLTRYNDVIHKIEGLARISSMGIEPLHIMLPVDSPTIVYVPYKLEDYQYFNFNRRFGDLIIGYNHIGRHPFEVFKANDLNVPTDQIICQNRIGPIHLLIFYDNDHFFNKSMFDKFYYSSGIKWPYALDDPRLAIGNIKIGYLKTVNKNILSKDKIINIVKSCNKIVGWSIE